MASAEITRTAQTDPLDPDFVYSNILDHPEADEIGLLFVSPYRKDATIQRAEFSVCCSTFFIGKPTKEEILGCINCRRRIYAIIPETLQGDVIPAKSPCGQDIEINVAWMKKELGGIHHYRRETAVLTFITPGMSDQQ